MNIIEVGLNEDIEILGEDYKIDLRVTKIKSGEVRLGFNDRRDVPINRLEVSNRIVEQEIGSVYNPYRSY